ncbi:hypothetical protein [Pontibacillus salipaludis]|uniref:Uncharacterized protein n=1 Tax=Pontibacillus salipaludis TaxID=1697394 RepID=A0ABQ1PX76_9BACI|nr:hypothetical protein [Pontibacillus salipaludis]GGD05509.1 hypothetical protein GCM10011389_11280 [Pontibacillus salipaludis]
MQLENLKEKKWVIPTVLITGFLFALIVGGYIGQSALEVEANDEVIKYEKLTSEISDLEKKRNELTSVKGELIEADKDLKEKQSEWEEYEEKYKELRDLELKKDQMISKKNSAEEELRSISKNIEARSKELEKIETGIVKAESEPIVLGAGHYSIGKDLPPGRYEASSVSGSGNMFVDSEVYERDIGVTLGGSYGEPSYVFQAVSGDSLRLGTSVKFTPIQ